MYHFLELFYEPIFSILKFIIIMLFLYTQFRKKAKDETTQNVI